MTAYRERREAGEYDAPAEPQESAPPPAEEDDGKLLADLKAEAEARGLPTSGTKAELRERLAAPAEESS